MIAKTHLDLHKDHLLWSSDLNMWLKDLEIWEGEMNRLLDNLRIIEQVVSGHLEAYEKHQVALLQHQELIKKHELDLTLLNEDSSYNQQLTEDHQIQAQSHLAHIDSHKQLKRYHYNIAKMINGLSKSLKESVR